MQTTSAAWGGSRMFRFVADGINGPGWERPGQRAALRARQLPRCGGHVRAMHRAPTRTRRCGRSAACSGTAGSCTSPSMFAPTRPGRCWSSARGCRGSAPSAAGALSGRTAWTERLQTLLRFFLPTETGSAELDAAGRGRGRRCRARASRHPDRAAHRRADQQRPIQPAGKLTPADTRDGPAWRRVPGPGNAVCARTSRSCRCLPPGL